MVEVDILGSAIDKEGSVKITEMVTKALNEIWVLQRMICISAIGLQRTGLEWN